MLKILKQRKLIGVKGSNKWKSKRKKDLREGRSEGRKWIKLKARS